jgi:hypothetical protein
MAGTHFKKSIKNETLRPYALASESPWVGISYRYDEAEPWQNALLSTFFVLPSNREDLRSDALHSFDVNVDVDAIRADGIDPDQVDLIVLTRDAFAKKVVSFVRKNIGTQSRVTFTVRRSELESTSLSARIDFHIMLVARDELWRDGRKIRKGGRLAMHVVSISAEKKGHSFNFSKTTAADFLARGLPASTTFHLDVHSPEGLIEPCDDVSSVLSVLVHEDVWSTLQEIRSGDRVGEALGAMFLSGVIFNVLLEAKQGVGPDRPSLDDGSVTTRLLSWLSDKAEKTPEELEQLLLDEDGMPNLQAMIQDSVRLTHSIHRVRLGEEEQA